MLLSPAMLPRFLALLGISVLIGLFTRSFAQNAVDNRPITRAGAVALFVESDAQLKARLEHHIQHRAPMPLFDDVNYDEWYAPYIETAFEAGIIGGNQSRTFRPAQNMTEEEAVVLAARFKAMSDEQTNAMVMREYNANWFDPYILASQNAGISIPTPVRLGQPVNRTVLYGMMESLSIANPSQIALSHRPAPVVAAIRTRTNTPATRAAVPNSNPNPVPQAPTGQGATSTQYASAKNFAITMPTLGITDLSVIHPSNPATKDGLLAPLQNGVGHLFSYPGAGGKILIYGHSSSYPWDVSKFTKIFRGINKLAVGDKIYVTYGGTLHVYQVTTKQTVPAEDTSAYGGSGEELILYTCWPPDSIKERYLVRAKPVEQVAVR